jgi:hypothetical protein
MCPRHINTDLDGQAACAAVTIYNNYQRWIDTGKQEDFIAFLGNRYAPVNELDPYDINRNWILNVKFWVHKIKTDRTI